MAENRLIKNRAIGICPSKAKMGIVLITRSEEQPRWIIDAWERYDIDSTDHTATYASMIGMFTDQNLKDIIEGAPIILNRRSVILNQDNFAIPVVMVKASTVHIPVTIFLVKAGFRVFLPMSVQFGSPTPHNENFVHGNDLFWDVFGDKAKEFVDASYRDKAQNFKPEPTDYYVPSKPRIFDDIREAANAALNYLTMMVDDIPALEYRPTLFGKSKSE